MLRETHKMVKYNAKHRQKEKERERKEEKCERLERRRFIEKDSLTKKDR